MMFIAATLTALIASVVAIPAPQASGASYNPCTGLENTMQCCSTDVLDGVVTLSCEAPPSQPTDASNYQAICAAIGKNPECCLLNLAGIDLLCAKPAGTL